MSKKIKKHYDSGHPVVGNRASVATWDLTVMFRTKEQCRLVINDVLKLEIDVNIAYSHDFDGTHTLHYVTIAEMSWGNNIVLIGKIFEKYDHCCLN